MKNDSKNDVELVDGDGYISDESSFYGDEDVRARLEELVSQFEPATYCATQHQLLPSIAIAGAEREEQRQKELAKLWEEAAKLYNPYKGLLYARQSDESVDDFLKRLPPLTTTAAALGPWIRIANPYAPKPPASLDVADLTTAGQALLNDFTAKKEALEKKVPHSAKATITKKMMPERKALEAALLKMAAEKGCTTGKWLLVPLPAHVDHVWRLVATATANNQLGVEAKVATDEGHGDRTPRMVHVYTKDFRSMEDVKRVLLKLVEMDLVQRPSKDPKGERSIYYKCDVYTYLGISSANQWGLKTSMYSSRDVLLNRT